MKTMTAIERFYRVKFIIEKIKALQEEIVGIEFLIPEVQNGQAIFACLQRADQAMDTAAKELKNLPTLANLASVLSMSIENVRDEKEKSAAELSNMRHEEFLSYLEKRRCAEVASETTKGPDAETSSPFLNR